MSIVKFEQGFEMKITEKQKELLLINSSVIDNFFDGDVLLIPTYISQKSFEKILHFLDICPAEIIKFERPIDKNEFHKKAYMFENWIQSIDKKELFDLLNSANYLIINSLIELLCAAIALKIKYMTNEEMQEYFTI